MKILLNYEQDFFLSNLLERKAPKSVLKQKI